MFRLRSLDIPHYSGVFSMALHIAGHYKRRKMRTSISTGMLSTVVLSCYPYESRSRWQLDLNDVEAMYVPLQPCPYVHPEPLHPEHLRLPWSLCRFRYSGRWPDFDGSMVTMLMEESSASHSLPRRLPDAGSREVHCEISIST